MILFESFSEIENILNWYNITNYTIDKDGLVNVDGSVNLHEKGLTKIPVKFGRVTGDFSCRDNQLTSLEGAPKIIDGNFYCYQNNLTSLEGAPKEVGGYFDCTSNHLTSLFGAPKRVVGNFYCEDNNIISFEGASKHVNQFFCVDNPVWEIWRLFRDYSKIELLNDYDAIQDGVVILDRLNDFLTTIGEEPVRSVEGWKCI